MHQRYDALPQCVSASLMLALSACPPAPEEAGDEDARERRKRKRRRRKRRTTRRRRRKRKKRRTRWRRCQVEEGKKEAEAG